MWTARTAGWTRGRDRVSTLRPFGYIPRIHWIYDILASPEPDSHQQKVILGKMHFARSRKVILGKMRFARSRKVTPVY